ncbi:MAG: hypothetical protein MJ014_00130 [Methanocorpusculum sp.]|nr:hypothetical protein [Methanocorpusculum sp.]
MMQDSVGAYKENPQDREMFAATTGVLANVLMSCARQIDRCYHDTGIPGTEYAGVRVFPLSLTNPYVGSKYLIVELSVYDSDFNPYGYNTYVLEPTLALRVTFPKPVMSRGDANAAPKREFDFRSLVNRLAVADALFEALAYVPYYKGREDTGVVIAAENMAFQDPMAMMLGVTYKVYASVEPTGEGPASLTVTSLRTAKDGVLETGDIGKFEMGEEELDGEEQFGWIRGVKKY